MSEYCQTSKAPVGAVVSAGMVATPPAIEVTGRTNPLENLSKYLRFVEVVRSRSVKTEALTVVVEEEVMLPELFITSWTMKRWN